MFSHDEVVIGHLPTGKIYGKVVVTETHTVIVWNVGTVLPAGKVNFPITSATPAKVAA